MHQLIFGPALFFDLPEYLNIVSNNSFFQVFSMGHFPIHPIFMGILWIMTRILPVNAIAMFFGAVSIFIFYQISKMIFKTGPYWLSTIIFSLFPAVWLINTNLMVESMTLTFFLFALYFFLSKKNIWFFVSLLLMVGTHIQSIFWIHAIFLVPYIFEINFKKENVVKFTKVALAGITFSTLFYIFLYYFSGRILGGTTEQLSTYFSSGILRMIRNIWLSFIRNFGTFTPFVLVFLLFKNVKPKQVFVSWILFFALVFIIGANWQGDFMGRRIVFAGVVLALGLYKYLKKWSVLFILYLVPIVIANIILYSNPSPFLTPNIPKGQVLIETHYVKPFITAFKKTTGDAPEDELNAGMSSSFRRIPRQNGGEDVTKYDGTVLWIGRDGLGIIDDYLKSGKRVFLTKQAVTAPYLLLVGQNYHITSLGKVGDSESRFLFKKYIIEPYADSFELKIFKGNVSKEAGEAVIYFDQGFWGRLVRRRIDYGDIGTWIWAIAANHRDPIGWIYKDVRGVLPLDKIM